MFFIVLCGFLLLKIFMDYKKGRCRSKNRLDGKTVIITGGGSGIGKETARDLAKRGARIIIIDINSEIALDAQKEIVEETNNKNIITKKADIGCFKSIRELARDLKNSEQKIDILIHNAGIGPVQQLNSDNIQLTHAVNLYGPFLLTHLLIDLLKKSDNSRIIFVSSLMAALAFVDFNKIGVNGDVENKRVHFWYSITKYGLIQLTKMFTKKLSGTNITVNAVHPGIVYTNIFKRHRLTNLFIKSIQMFTKTPEEGAQSSIFAAVDDVGGKVSGMIFVDCKQFNMFNSEKDRKNAEVLWEKCEEIVKLNDSERL